MKRQTRPFAVQIKHKRGSPRQRDSMWGDFDLSAMVAEASKEFPEPNLSNHQLVDTHVSAINSENMTRAEDIMADPTQARSMTTLVEASVRDEAGMATTSTSSSAPAMQGRLAEKKAAAKTPVVAGTAVRKVKRIYSRDERSQLLEQIARSISHGESLRSAARQAGISEQTYYNWKSAKPAVENDDTNLSSLEAENVRLKKLLAERLHSENAELRKKLGLD